MKPSYMTRPQEIAKQPDAVTAFERIASGSTDPADRPHVFNAVWSFWNWAHALDDLIDEGIMTDDQRDAVLQALSAFCWQMLTGAERDPDQRILALIKNLLRDSGWDEERRQLAWDAFVEFVGNLAANPFYRRHAAEHGAMFDMMLARTLDADYLEKTRPNLAPLLPAIRCADVDFLVHCAKLAGGWRLMREVGMLRDYDMAP